MSARDPLFFARQTAGVDVQVARAMRFAPVTGAPVDQCAPGSAPAAAPTGVDLTSLPPVRLIFPPQQEKLAASQDFNVNNYRLILPAGVGSTVQGPSFTAPKDQIGWLQNFSQYVLAPSGATYAMWTLQLNGAPVPGYDNVYNPPGIANLVEVFQNSMRVRVGMGQTVSFLITNLDASGPYTVGGLLRGWYHPKAAEDRMWNMAP